MKNFRTMILTTIFLLNFVLAAHAQGAALKIAFLDLSRVFDSYGKTKEYDSVLEGEQKAYEKERNEKLDKLKEAEGKLAALTEAEKGKMSQQMEQMKSDLMSFDQAKRTDLTKKRDEKIREILLEIEKMVSDFAKKEKYDLILNDRVLIYGNETLDITEQISKVLNESYNKK